MRHLKDLVLAVQHTLKDNPAAKTAELERAIDAANEFLTSSKSFEYIGPIEVPYTAIKLIDFGQDFDDVLKLLAGKKTDAKLNGELYFISHADQLAADATVAAELTKAAA